MPRIRQFDKLFLLRLDHFDEVVPDSLLVDFELVDDGGFSGDLLYL